MTKAARWVPLSIALFAPVNVAAQSKTNATSGLAADALGNGFLLQFITGLGLVLVCIFGIVWLMRRFGSLQSSANGSLRVVGGLPLSSRERVVLVQVGEDQVLLGVAPGRVQAVHVLRTPIRFGDDTSSPTQFSQRLKEALRMEKAS